MYEVSPKMENLQSLAGNCGENDDAPGDGRGYPLSNKLIWISSVF